MERSNFRLRSLLIEIDRHLTNADRQKLCFLIGCEDVPRRLLDIVTKDGAPAMNDVWEALFDRRKITTNNVNYLIERLDRIERSDMAELLRNYCPISLSLSTIPTEARN